MFGFGFKFLDFACAQDGELSLVSPSVRFVDAVVEAEHSGESTGSIADTRARIEDFLSACPLGHQKGDRSNGRVPAYHFWMHIDRRHPKGAQVPLTIAGGLGFRVGQNRELEFYSGHFGYHVYPPARGHHYAERAVRLLFPLAKLHNLSPIWITCNPDNFPSRRTCERLGGTLVDIVDIPTNHPFFDRGERQKCRYRFTP